MRAGPLRHRVTLQQATAARDAAGGSRKVWADIADRWAEITPARGKDRVEAEQIKAKNPVLVRLRFVSAGLDSSWRIVHGSTIYHIDSVVNVGERDIMHECNCYVTDPQNEGDGN